ncbi:tRNA wybutosine-synthesizing protein 3 homolog [Oncorhynchus tshawytscha]|uniref:tRNA wybutosine-synthesizing protein 3 homolog n=1 Tax=Oncorhynchus tshawytscha TaxID=74940 RepID=UPI000D098927|nr:tRNA wybutosine-synthesizing protein 3 homolog [Oncorhynchus tshawytscha]
MSARKEDISHIVSAINNSAYYFTTSSCSGRILLIDGHSLAINSGFRNSGLTVDKKGKIITVLVKEDYIYFLVEVANQKMEENVKQIERFYEWLQSALQPAEPQSPSRQEMEEKSVYKQRRKRGQTNV